MKKQSLKVKITFSVCIVAFSGILSISFLFFHLMKNQFIEYNVTQRIQKLQILCYSLGQQYDPNTEQWNIEEICEIGMQAVKDGYLIRIYDKDTQKIIWDTRIYDMPLATKTIKEISQQMKRTYPNLKGAFSPVNYKLEQSGTVIGHVNISYYRPFFFSNNDFKFLNNVKAIIIIICLLALSAAYFTACIQAGRISTPIKRIVNKARLISNKKYELRIIKTDGSIEMEMLKDSVNRLASSLVTLEMLRKQLTDDLSHEFRTPLTVLRSYLETMLDGVWEPTEERLSRCYDQTIRMGKLVSDMLDLAMITSNNLKLNKTDVNISELITYNINCFKRQLEQKHINVEINGPKINVFADEARANQVVSNLLSNAINYGLTNGKIEFELFETNISAGFHIKDNGIGIEQEELAFIFEQFYRTNKSREISTEGSGLSLAIVKSIMEAHGGSVKVESISGKGSVFTVIFPR